MVSVLVLTALGTMDFCALQGSVVSEDSQHEFLKKEKKTKEKAAPTAPAEHPHVHSKEPAHFGRIDDNIYLTSRYIRSSRF